MLLKHEVYAERALQTLNLRAEKVRTYSHLKVDPLQFSDGKIYYQGSRDLLVSVFFVVSCSMDVLSTELATVTTPYAHSNRVGRQ
jgi:DNA cross-link repair 1C protein